mgnify:CR=1 FL=1
MSRRQTSLRPEEGGRFAQPVGPDAETVAKIRAHDDCAVRVFRGRAETPGYSLALTRAETTGCRCCGVPQPNEAWREHEAACVRKALEGFSLTKTISLAPARPKFKAGDWVRHTHNGVGLVVAAAGFGCWAVEVPGVAYREMWDPVSLEPWTPRVGERVFSRSLNTAYTVVKIQRTVYQGTWYLGADTGGPIEDLTPVLE